MYGTYRQRNLNGLLSRLRPLDILSSDLVQQLKNQWTLVSELGDVLSCSCTCLCLRPFLCLCQCTCLCLFLFISIRKIADFVNEL